MRSSFPLALVLGLASFPTSDACAQGLRITTWMYDNGHTGQNLKETTLTPANVSVNSFSKLGAYAVDGQVYAQPLYWQGLTTPKGTFDVLFVVTENDGVYAFDADNPGTAAIWYVNFTSPPNITAVPCAEIEKSCHVSPVVGITGTPVIDAATQTMYLVVRTKEISGVKTSYVQRLHALDITTGSEKSGGPVVVAATASSTTFSSQHSSQRPGLILVPAVSGGHSTVYIAFAGYTHTGSLVLPGWVMAYDSRTLHQLAVFDTTPTGKNGGVWGSGGGMTADAAGNIYIATADGTFDVNTGGADYGESVLKLKLSGSVFTVLDYFTPKEQSCRTQNDFDLGSGSPLLLPHDTSGKVTDEFLMAGKGGSPCDLFNGSYAAPVYVLNQKQLGHFSNSKDNVVQTVPGAPSGYWSAPAYWQGTSSKYVYYGGVVGDASLGPGDNLKMWTLSAGLLSSAPVAQSPAIFEVGVTPSISANGNTNGILWAIERQDRLGLEGGTKPAVLHAYDATNIANELYNSSQAGARDQAGPATKYVVPTVANGRVYVGTQTEVDVYGLTK